MEESVSAATARRKFSVILGHVREGRSYVVTSRGQPVARIVPAGSHEEVMARAKTVLLSRLEAQPVLSAESWRRDELYEGDR